LKRIRIDTLLLLVLLLISITAIAKPGQKETHNVAMLYNDFGVAHALRGEWSRARIFFDSAVYFDSANNIILNNVGNYFLSMGQSDSAIGYYERSLLSDTANKEPLYNLSIAHLLNGNADKAINLMQEALESIDTSSELWSLIEVSIDELGIQKGDPIAIGRLEISRLMEAARKRRDDALQKKNKPQSDSSAIDSFIKYKNQDTTKLDSIQTVRRISGRIDIASSLYWMPWHIE